VLENIVDNATTAPPEPSFVDHSPIETLDIPCHFSFFQKISLKFQTSFRNLCIVSISRTGLGTNLSTRCIQLRRLTCRRGSKNPRHSFLPEKNRGSITAWTMLNTPNYYSMNLLQFQNYYRHSVCSFTVKCYQGNRVRYPSRTVVILSLLVNEASD
jgi:hypothetical protein